MYVREKCHVFLLMRSYLMNGSHFYIQYRYKSRTKYLNSQIPESSIQFSLRSNSRFVAFDFKFHALHGNEHNMYSFPNPTDCNLYIRMYKVCLPRQDHNYNCSYLASGICSKSFPPSIQACYITCLMPFVQQTEMRNRLSNYIAMPRQPPVTNNYYENRLPLL